MQPTQLTTKQIVLSLFTILLVTAFGPGTAGAQGMSQPPAKQQPVVTQGDLESFAGAYINVSRISKAYEPRIGNAESAGQAQQLQQEANEKMTQAVKNEGLTVNEYNEIFEAVQQDPSLEQELMALIREMR